MTRNRDEVSKKVFSILKKEVTNNEEYTEGLDLDKIRWVKGDEKQKNILENTKVYSQYKLSSNKTTALFTYENECYFITVGFSNKIKYDFLNHIEMKAGMFATIIYELNVSPIPNMQKLIIEKVLGQHSDDDGYEGHDYKELKEFFVPINIFKIKDDCVIDKKNLNCITGIYLCGQNNKLSLNYSNETIEKYRKIFSNESSFLLYENILSSIYNISFKYSFLDLYRSIEKLYYVVYVQNLNHELNNKYKINELLSKLQNSLDNWKPNYRNAIKMIIKKVPQSYLSEIEKVKTKLSSQKTNLAKWIYDLRNSIVHLSPNDNPKNIKKLSSENWNKIISGILDILIYWHDELENYYNLNN